MIFVYSSEKIPPCAHAPTGFFCYICATKCAARPITLPRGKPPGGGVNSKKSAVYAEQNYTHRAGSRRSILRHEPAERCTTHKSPGRSRKLVRPSPQRKPHTLRKPVASRRRVAAPHAAANLTEETLFNTKAHPNPCNNKAGPVTEA